MTTPAHMAEADRPMSPLMKVVFWFVAVNALVGALSLIFFPGDTARLFFWEISPPSMPLSLGHYTWAEPPS
jgi:hypothetical protein